jgi:hypothetical protein
LANSGELFQNLRKYVRGSIDKYELERSDSAIERVIEDPIRGMTKIIFEFKDEDEFFNALHVGDDDAWFARVVSNPHSDGYSFRDDYMVDEDFKSGYSVFYEFNEENREKLLSILSVVDPSFDYEDMPSEETNKRAAEIMLKFFEKETNNIVDDWGSELNRGANESARELVKSEINEVLNENGFKLRYEFDSVQIDVGHLIMLYLKLGKPWLSFKKLFKDVYLEQDRIGGWSENAYEYENNSNFDKDSFNSYVDSQLSKMEDEVENIENLEAFTGMVDRIKKKFKPNVSYNVPKLKDKGVTFVIKGFDKDDMKILVNLRQNLKQITRKVSEENFYNLLYQPELFDFGFDNV